MGDRKLHVTRLAYIGDALARFHGPITKRPWQHQRCRQHAPVSTCERPPRFLEYSLTAYPENNSFLYYHISPACLKSEFEWNCFGTQNRIYWKVATQFFPLIPVYAICQHNSQLPNAHMNQDRSFDKPEIISYHLLNHWSIEYSFPICFCLWLRPRRIGNID